VIVKFFTAVLIAFATACGGSRPGESDAGPSSATDPANVGTITGTIRLDGPAPAAEFVRLDADPKCAAMAAGPERPNDDVVVGDGNGLQNVFVYVKDGLPPRMYPVPAEPVVLDQQQCRYVPRVFGVQVGQQLTIRNSDPLLHNVRAEGAINEPFDVGTPVQGMEVKRTFATREVMVPFKCNVHSWMQAYAGVVEHPFFAVTDAAGRFTIRQLPPGTYTLEIWHERFGTHTQQVTVTAAQPAEIALSYKAS
jgi:plastocyanin